MGDLMVNPDAPRTRFVILAAPRTGSNMLCTLLDSHPEIRCHHEIFNPSGIFRALPLRDSSAELGTVAERDRQPLVFLDRFWRSDVDCRCIGFKMTRDQNEEVLRAVLADRGVFKIVLKRRNRLRTYVSERIAALTGQWEVYRATDLVRERPKIFVDLADWRRHIAVNAACYDRIDNDLAASGQSFAAVVYERLLEKEEQQRLLEFLGVSPQTDVLRITSVRQNAANLSELIANYVQLEESLLKSDLAPELHDASI